MCLISGDQRNPPHPLQHARVLSFSGLLPPSLVEGIVVCVHHLRWPPRRLTRHRRSRRLRDAVLVAMPQHGRALRGDVDLDIDAAVRRPVWCTTHPDP